MKSSITALLLVVVLSSTGCHRHVVMVDPVTSSEVIGMTRRGAQPQEIIEKIDASGTVYHMTSKDVLDLNREGVDAQVIDHMMRTAERDAERRAEHYRRSWGCYDPWYPHWHYYYHPHIEFGFGYHCW
jgi:hypothetical protein